MKHRRGRALRRRYGRSGAPSRFSRELFGGGDVGERAANVALRLHESVLHPGVAVRVYRGSQAGLTGHVAAGDAPGRAVYVIDSDGLRWAVETRNLEVLR